MTVAKHTEFSSLPLRAELQQTLNASNYVQLSPIQSASADAILGGRDVLAQAETGSGKTLAFAIGLLNKLDLAAFETQALVICPTRELSDQVAAEIRRLASNLANARVLTLSGGKPMHDQLTSLKREPHIVVGTPGRLKKHLEKGSLSLGNIRTLVLDEADRMLDMGFLGDIMSLLEKTPESRQTLLFSATYPEEVVGIGRSVQKNPVEVRVEASHTPNQIEQWFIYASDEQKPEALVSALGRFQPDNAIIFCNRRNQVNGLCDALRQEGFYARSLHGDMEQRDRDEAIILFSNRSINFLVATDVAARGLDVSALSAVINYDLTPDPETHLHRVGRTGRAGLEGIAITFVKPDETRRLNVLEGFMQTKARVIELSPADRKRVKVAPPATSTLQINVGKKDKIRPGDIVGALTAETALTNNDIGKITVLARVSFVAIDYSQAKTALRILTDGRIKRQKVKARLVR